jgi:hypothetical protein
MPPMMQHKQEDADVNPKAKVTLMMPLEAVFTTILWDAAGFLQIHITPCKDPQKLMDTQGLSTEVRRGINGSSWWLHYMWSPDSNLHCSPYNIDSNETMEQHYHATPQGKEKESDTKMATQYHIRCWAEKFPRNSVGSNSSNISDATRARSNINLTTINTIKLRVKPEAYPSFPSPEEL